MPQKQKFRRISESIAGALAIVCSGALWLMGFKFVALWLGPEGVGCFSQLRQLIQAGTICSTYGGSNTIVQGISVRRTEIERGKFRTTASRLIGVSGVLVVALIALTAPAVAHYTLGSKSPDFITAIYWAIPGIVLSILGTYAIAILNGYRSYIYMAAAQISGPAALVLLLCTLWWSNLPFTPVLLAQCFLLCFLVTYFVSRYGMSRLRTEFTPTPSCSLPRDERYAFYRFALASLLAALSSSATLLLIRSWLIGAHDLAFAGLFDACWTITFNYATIFLSACNALYLPALSSSTTPQTQRALVLKTAYFVLGSFVLIFYPVVMFRDSVLTFFYSEQFSQSAQALPIFVVAVLFRAVSWVYGSTLVAGRESRILLVSELALNALTLATALTVLTKMSLSMEALAWAFVLPQFLYLVFSIEYVQMKNPSMHRLHIWPLMFLASVPLLYTIYSSNSPEIRTSFNFDNLLLLSGAITIFVIFIFARMFTTKGYVA
jgi:O-antigen/teichoic acid export membrane protein